MEELKQSCEPPSSTRWLVRCGDVSKSRAGDGRTCSTRESHARTARGRRAHRPTSEQSICPSGFISFLPCFSPILGSPGLLFACCFRFDSFHWGRCLGGELCARLAALSRLYRGGRFCTYFSLPLLRCVPSCFVVFFFFIFCLGMQQYGQFFPQNRDVTRCSSRWAEMAQMPKR